MINAIFNENDRLTGYSAVPLETSKTQRTIIEVSESELNKLIPDSFEETDWKQVRRHYKLDEEGGIVFDEDFEPETEEQ